MTKVEVEIYKCSACKGTPCFTAVSNKSIPIDCLINNVDGDWEKVSNQYMLYEFDKVTG